MLASFGGYRGPFKALLDIELNIKDEIEKTVSFLSGDLGERNIQHKKNLDTAAEFIQSCFIQCGLSVVEQEYLADGLIVKNIIGEKKGTKDEIIVIGAHYDSVYGSPGADDNASGVAAIIAIANLLEKKKFPNTIRFIAFCTEEPPFFYSQQMGSWQYAHMVKNNREKIKGMLSIESIGYYSVTKKSQHYPLFLGAFYPDKADFIGFVANLTSGNFLTKVLSLFRKNIQFPSEGISAPTIIPGISWSDQWPFWRMGFRAIMITDTAPYRNPNYHSAYDLPHTLDYDRMARVTYGLMLMLCDLAST